jgi:hypothetical protein
MKKIAVLLPGIIRNYSHLEFIPQLRDQGKLDGFEFYFFGYCYDFLGSGRHHWHFNREYANKKTLDLDLINSYPLSKLKITNTIIEKDADGFDGRILSQWEGVKQSFLLCEEFTNETSINFDLIMRCRWDVSINYDRLKRVLKDSLIDNKLKVVKYKTITDQGFIGDVNQMKILCKFADNYYDVLSVDHFVNLQAKHRSFVSDILRKNPRARDPRNAHNLRFEPQSESMLTYFVDNNFKPSHKTILRHRHKWWELRRD